MKKINWKRIVLYVIGILVLFRLFTEAYIRGVFHPEEVMVNDMIFTAPKNAYLVSVSKDGKSLYDLFSPLKLNFNTEYKIDSNQTIHISFDDVFRRNELKDIGIVQMDKHMFNKYVKAWKKEKKDYRVSLLFDRYGDCSEVYQISKNLEKEPFVHIILFNEEKKMQFSILLGKMDELDRTLAEVCQKNSLRNMNDR